MAAWSRLRNSFSSLPTTTSPSSSPSSSSASLYPPLLLDLADDLWFYSSVIPLPSLSLPCLPALFSTSPPPPDPSTLIAQCMITHLSPSPRLLALPLSSSSSSSSPPPPPDSQPQSHLPSWILPTYHEYPTPPDNQESVYRGYNQEAVYGGHSSLSDSDEDDNAYRGYPRANAGEDEETYYYYTAPSDGDWDDVSSDGEDEQQVQETMPADLPKFHAHAEEDDTLESDDALSGIYDAGVLLKDQHQKRTHFQRDAASLEQREMKENLKMWAHAVALTLPWKAAAQARPLL